MQVFVAMMVLSMLAPFAIYPLFLMNVLCFALFACAFNLLVGYVGLLSFGHAMFFGFAAYISGYTVKVWGWPTEVGILAGTAVAAVLGLLAGAITIRRQGIYFAMVTLALAQMVFFFCLQAKFTGGEDGIQAIPRRSLFGVLEITNDFIFYYVVLAIFAIGFLIIYRTIHSPSVKSSRPSVRERGARDLAWLCGRSFQADCLRTFRRTRRSRRGNQGDRLLTRLADRRDLADVG
jgi:branched-chain amino acid transport system permease protein